MTDTAIKVENLSKRYRIGQYAGSGAQYKTLRESLTNAVSAPLRRLRQTGDRRRKTEERRARSPISGPLSPVPGPSSTDRFIWALKDVSFEVKQGEVLGIIGKNGAGKSTLLKILTGITEPTEGRAELKGRVNSLLEVGTGFHPELTGRENVRLSGAILGMARKEIDRKFDEIVDFSGVEQFIDTPVKRYSSGMRVRLGFAVAAHLEPEILLIDEVLAVGDAQFQKKCLGKMGDVAKEGRTVLFVSHSMPSVSGLCSSGLLLKQGAVAERGDVHEVIASYLQTQAGMEASGIVDLTSKEVSRVGTGSSRFQQLCFVGHNGEIKSTFQVGEQFEIRLECYIYELKPEQFYQIRIRSASGIPIYHWVDFDDGLSFPSKPGLDRVSAKLDRLMLYPGRYIVSVVVSDRYGTGYDAIEDEGIFDVVAGSMVPLSRKYFRNLGMIHEVAKWRRQTQ